MTNLYKWLEAESLVEYCEEQGLDIEAVSRYCYNHHIEPEAFPDEARDFENSYIGYWEDFEDFAREDFEARNEIPDHLLNFIDWKTVAREAKHNYWEIDGYTFA